MLESILNCLRLLQCLSEVDCAMKLAGYGVTEVIESSAQTTVCSHEGHLPFVLRAMLLVNDHHSNPASRAVPVALAFASCCREPVDVPLQEHLRLAAIGHCVSQERAKLSIGP